MSQLNYGAKSREVEMENANNARSSFCAHDEKEDLVAPAICYRRTKPNPLSLQSDGQLDAAAAAAGIICYPANRTTLLKLKSKDTARQEREELFHRLALFCNGILGRVT